MVEAGDLYGQAHTRRGRAGSTDSREAAMPGAQPALAAGRSSTGVANEVQALKLHVLESMEAARTIWRSFERRAIASPFQTYTWLSAWQANVGEPGAVSPLIVFGYDQSERLSLLMPLGVETAGGRKTLIWLGDGMAGYNAPLIDPGLLGSLTPQVVEVMWGSIVAHVGRVDVLRLRRQPKTIDRYRNPFIHGAKSAAAQGGRTLPLPSTWSEFAAEHIGEGHHTGADYARHLRQRGRLAIGLNLPSQSRTRVVERILATARSQAGRRVRSSVLLDDGVGSFLKTLALSEETGFFSVSAVNVDEEMLAASIGYVHGNRYYLSITTLEQSEDGRAAECLLFEELIRSCIVQGIRSIDCLGGTAAIPEWTRAPMPLYETVSGRSTVGMFSVGLGAMKQSIGLGGKVQDMASGSRLVFTPTNSS